MAPMKFEKNKEQFTIYCKVLAKTSPTLVTKQSVLGDLSEISMGEVVDFQLTDEAKMTLQGEG